jgi:hypothetical protein
MLRQEENMKITFELISSSENWLARHMPDGVVQINRDKYFKLPSKEQGFVLANEMLHAVAHAQREQANADHQ